MKRFVVRHLMLLITAALLSGCTVLYYFVGHGVGMVFACCVALILADDYDCADAFTNARGSA
jgi:Na+-translocating ferredoxin:NAD+ oxidoreductase RnfD subunit